MARPDRGTAPLRLTRRGRVVVRVVVVLLVTLAVTAIVLGAGGVARASRDAAPLPVTVHVVLPGETLWSIAGELAPGVDRRDTVARLIQLNRLPGAALRVGDRLVLPLPR